MLKFFKCEVCKNIIVKLADSGVSVSCCGKPMKELVPGAVDGALEKHVPAVTVEGKNVKVQIGEVLHPMLEEHFIQFIALETKNGFQVNTLRPAMNRRLNLLLPLMTKQLLFMSTATFTVSG